MLSDLNSLISTILIPPTSGLMISFNYFILYGYWVLDCCPLLTSPKPSSTRLDRLPSSSLFTPPHLSDPIHKDVLPGLFTLTSCVIMNCHTLSSILFLTGIRPSRRNASHEEHNGTPVSRGGPIHPLRQHPRLQLALQRRRGDPRSQRHLQRRLRETQNGNNQRTDSHRPTNGASLRRPQRGSDTLHLDEHARDHITSGYAIGRARGYRFDSLRGVKGVLLDEIPSARRSREAGRDHVEKGRYLGAY